MSLLLAYFAHACCMSSATVYVRLTECQWIMHAYDDRHSLSSSFCPVSIPTWQANIKVSSASAAHLGVTVTDCMLLI